MKSLILTDDCRYRYNMVVCATFFGVALILLFMSGGAVSASDRESKKLEVPSSDVVQQRIPPRDIVVAFDTSYSVDGEFIIQSVISQSIDALHCDWRLGAIVFGGSVSVAVDLKPPGMWTSTDYEAIAQAKHQVDDGTNFSETLRLASEQLMNTKTGFRSEKRIVLVTDGEFYTGDGKKAEEADNMQRQATWQIIENDLIPSGIKLIVLDTNGVGLDDDQTCGEVTGNDSCEWKIRADRNGRYFETNARGDYHTTLRDAFVEPFNAIIQNDRTIPMNVWPYRRSLALADYWIIEEPATVTLIAPDGNEYSPKKVNGDSYNVSVVRPDEGRWSLDIDVGREGAVDISRLESQLEINPNPFQALNLLLRREDYTKQLQRGQALRVRFSIRDEESPNIAIEDDRFRFTGRLESEEEETVHSVTIQPVREEGYMGYYEVNLDDTHTLQGPYRLVIEGGHQVARDIVFNEDWPIFFGCVPAFADKPSVLSRDLKIGTPFSVTVRLDDMEIVGSPHVNLSIEGPENYQLVVDMQEGDQGFIVRIPALSASGTYRISAILGAGTTIDGVRFEEIHSKQASIEVRDLTPWERYGKEVSIASGFLMLGFVLRFGYPLIFRIASGWVDDFDVIGELVR